MSKGRRQKQAAAAKRQAQITLDKREMRYEGVIPPPEMYGGYEDVLEGSADRILKMAEKQQEHRFALEKSRQNTRNELAMRELKSTIILDGLSRVLGFIIILTVVGGGVYLVSQGNELGGYASVIVGLATLIGTYLWGRKKGNSEEFDEK